MNPSNWHLVSMMVLALISTASSATSNREQHGQQQLQKRQIPANQSLNLQPYWEHILREFVFKTISPPPLGNNQLYKRLLDAPFYAGPFPVISNDVPSLVLSRGDVYYLPNGHWLFCQEGCVDCKVCAQFTHPTVKWVLRRVKRYSTRGSTRHDLQLTILPQSDGSYHMNNLWLRSYIYVTSQGEQADYWNDKLGLHGSGAYVNLEDGTFILRERSNNFWRYSERKNEPTTEKEVLVNIDFQSTTEAPKVTSEKIPLKEPRKQRLPVKTSDKKGMNISWILNENVRDKLKQFVPKLILGTDQTGQKHLVHVIPADGSTNGTSINSIASNVLNSTGQSKNSYQWILRRIFDSLNSNRRSIENFLEPLAQAEKADRLNEDLEDTKNGVMSLKELARLYPFLDKRTRDESLLHNRWPFTLNWSRQRRTSNDKTVASNLMNSTGDHTRDSSSIFNLNPETKNRNNRNRSAGSRSGIANRNYYSNDTSNDSFAAINVTQNGQKYKFTPRKFQLIVGTESTTKSGVIVNPNKMIQEQYDSVPTNHSVELKGLKFR